MDPTVLVNHGRRVNVHAGPERVRFSNGASHARTDPPGLEVFGIAHRACFCTPPRRRRSWITPQLRGASPGTRVEETATVGAT